MNYKLEIKGDSIEFVREIMDSYIYQERLDGTDAMVTNAVISVEDNKEYIIYETRTIVGKPMNYLDDLDKAAKVNLNEYDLKEYFRYQKEMLDDGDAEDDIEMVLTGFIWDCTEEYELKGE